MSSRKRPAGSALATEAAADAGEGISPESIVEITLRLPLARVKRLLGDEISLLQARTIEFA